MSRVNLFLILIFLFLISCGNVGKILRNEKISTTDEFLVEKKKPLILPPDFEQVPMPGSKNEIKIEDKDILKEILNKDNKKTKISNKSSSVEESIIKKLPK